MKSPNFVYESIEKAKSKLGYPEKIWFRGHTDRHQLIPALLRFNNGIKKERQIIRQYSEKQIRKKLINTCLSTIISMHHSYLPTRLIGWTDSFHVALFCALVRDTDHPSIFILDPVKLNKKSKHEKILSVENNIESILSNFIVNAALPYHPVAIDGEYKEEDDFNSKNLYTVHGKNEKPLEAQCPDCVIKVILTKEERSYAEEELLSEEWIKHQLSRY